MAGPWEDYQTTTKQTGQEGPWMDYQSVSSAQPQGGEKGFLSRIADDASKRYQKVMPGDYSITPSPLRAVGQTAGFIGDVAGEGLKSAYTTLVPTRAQEAVKSGIGAVMDTGPGKLVKRGAGAVAEGYGKFKETFPEAATDIESATNIAMLLPPGRILKPVAKEGAAIVKDVGSLMRAAKRPSIIDSEIKDVVKGSLQKAGIKPKPSMALKSDQFYDKASMGAKRIIERAKEIDDFEIPRNLEGFVNATSRAKKLEIEDIAGALERVGKKEIPTTHQVAAIDEWLASDVAKGIKAKAPNVIKEAEDLRKTLVDQKFYTPGELNESVIGYNELLRILYQSPDPKTHNLKGLYAKIADVERKTLDKFVKDLGEPEFQKFKDNWGALKEIESRVAQKANREAGKGKITAWDTVLGSVGISAILHANPQLLTTALLATAGKQGLRHLRSPDRIVRKMFKDVDKIIEKRATIGEPALQSRTMRGLTRADELEAGLGTGVLRPGATIAGVDTGARLGNFAGREAVESSPYSPEFAAELKARRAQQAPIPGQGFELVQPKAEGPGLIEAAKIAGPDTGLSQWIKDRGGIWDKTLTGETAQFGGKQAKTVGLINQKTGKPFDELAAMAVDDGWLPPGSGAREFIDMVGQDLRALRAKKPELRPVKAADAEAMGQGLDSQAMTEGAKQGEWADEILKRGFQYLGPKGTVVGGQLEIPGSKIIYKGEEFTSKGKVGGNVILKDGETIKLGLFDEIQAEGVKLKRKVAPSSRH